MPPLSLVPWKFYFYIQDNVYIMLIILPSVVTCIFFLSGFSDESHGLWVYKLVCIDHVNVIYHN